MVTGFQPGHPGYMGKLTHGCSSKGKRTPAYRSWAAMLQRCTNPKNPNFHRYGARGITVCDRWRSFENFLEDMGERPPGLTLERVDNEMGYEPGNCVWATQVQQCRNQERTVMVEIDGVVKPRIEWCEIYNIPYPAVRIRINRRGWDPVAAITTPIKSRQRDEAGRITWA